MKTPTGNDVCHVGGLPEVYFHVAGEVPEDSEYDVEKTHIGPRQKHIRWVGQ